MTHFSFKFIYFAIQIQDIKANHFTKVNCEENSSKNVIIFCWQCDKLIY